LAFLLASASSACGNSASPAAPIDSGGGGLDTSAPFHAPPCIGDASVCLTGTATTAAFTVTPAHLRASLYRTFPSGRAGDVNQVTSQTQTVARDNTFALSGLDPWAHYYLLFEPGFHIDAGVKKTVATRVGPLVVPVMSTDASIGVQVKPVQLDVLEQGATAGAMQLQSAVAHLFDAKTGDEIGAGGSASILVGTTSTPMPYDSTKGAFAVQFATPPAAQLTYAITTSTAPGEMPATWTLVADPPTFAGAITSPPAGATVPAGRDLTVTWPLQPAADYVIVELFRQDNGAFTSVYTSQIPRAADSNQETIPGGSSGGDGGLDGGAACCLATPGTYLINVAFTKANCPPTADGCVHAGIVAGEQIAVQ
jgi:hypothetical protein